MGIKREPQGVEDAVLVTARSGVGRLLDEGVIGVRSDEKCRR